MKSLKLREIHFLQITSITSIRNKIQIKSRSPGGFITFLPWLMGCYFVKGELYVNILCIT